MGLVSPVCSAADNKYYFMVLSRLTTVANLAPGAEEGGGETRVFTALEGTPLYRQKPSSRQQLIQLRG